MSGDGKEMRDVDEDVVSLSDRAWIGMMSGLKSNFLPRMTCTAGYSRTNRAF